MVEESDFLIKYIFVEKKILICWYLNSKNLRKYFNI